MAAFESIASAADTLTCAKPSGTVEGDVLVAFTLSGGVASASGWTEVEVGPIFGIYNLTVLAKAAGASEPPQYTFTASGGQYGSAIMRASGGNLGNLIDGTPSVNSVGTLAMTCTGIDVTSNDALLVMATVSGTSDGATVDPAMGERLQLSAAGGGLGLTIGTESLAVPGNTGTRTFTREDNPPDCRWCDVRHFR